MKSKVLVIVGPTASGKSDFAVKLAKKINGEIISADSRQVYKGLDIGSGKITKKEMRGIPHHLLDVVDLKKQFSVADYKKLALKKIKEILERKKIPIVVGGSGFYIDSLQTKLPDVPPNKKLRKKLERYSAEKLFLMLKSKDKERAKNIDRHNKVRLIRALEIVEALGKVPRKMELETEYDFEFIGLSPKNLEKRIHKRLIKRMPRMIKEVKDLKTKGVTWKRFDELGLEYRYVSKYLKGEMQKGETVEKLFIEIKRYAKRQMTWFKRNKKINWVK